MMGLFYVYLMTYGGAAVSLFDPFVGFLIYVSFAVLKPEAVWPWSISGGNFSRIIAIALLIGWSLKGFGRWDLGRGKAVILALVGYFVWTIISASQAPDREVAWAFVDRYARIVLPILVGITTINSLSQLRLLAWVILLSQAYPAYELNQTYFGGYNQLKEEGFGGLDNNGYACALVTTVGPACFLAWHSERWWQKTLAGVCAAVIVHAILFSFSRGGMVGLLVVGLTSFVVMPKGRKELTTFVLAAVLVVSLAGPQVQARFRSAFAEGESRDSSAQFRLEVWAVCWDMALKNPAFGIGPSHFPLVIDRYGFPKGREAHTLWLVVGAELGFPGVLLLIAYYGICIVRLWPIALGKVAVPDPWAIYLARMIISSLIGFLVSAQFLSIQFLETPYYVALMGACVLKLSGRGPRPARERPMS